MSLKQWQPFKDLNTLRQQMSHLRDRLLTLTRPKVTSDDRSMVKDDVEMEQKARSATTHQRQHEEHRQEQVHTRASTDLETPPDGIKEEARELTAAQRQHEEELQDKAHTRASQEVNSPSSFLL